MKSGETQSLLRAVAILDCFSSDQPELGVRDAARQLKMSRSTVGRLLATMQSAGILHQNVTTRRYMMSPKILTWGSVYLGALDLRTEARPRMEELECTTRETVSLYVLNDDEAVCIERIESSQNLRLIARLGERLPLHTGASGKVLLAFASTELAKEIIAALPLKDLKGSKVEARKALLTELGVIRARGYVVSHGEHIEDASCVSAPILDADGNGIATLTVTGPTLRFTDDKVREYTSLVTQAAARVSQALGYPGPSIQSSDRSE